MKYISTRSNVENSFEEVLFRSYDRDGGLFVPKNIPQVGTEILEKWKNLGYIDLVKKIVSLFVSPEEVPFDDQRTLLEEAFTNFDTKNVVELTRLKNGLNILELWHGDTLAFKDLSMTCLLQFLNYFLKKRKSHFTAIVATSGDTGSSAMYAAQHVDNIDLLVLYPYNRISSLQELMMTTLKGKRLHVYAVDGNSDDIDVAVMKILNDDSFIKEHNVGTMNSQNWCRVMVQIAHHIYGYLQTTKQVGKPVNIFIPCGGCGNLSALLIARQMGIPICPIATSNKNDTVHRLLSTNQFVVNEVNVSLAPAMDIAFGPNYERVVWLLANQDPNIVKKFFSDFHQNNKSCFPEEIYAKVASEIRSSTSSDDVILDAVKRCWDENKYLVCPHTATAVAHFWKMIDNKSARIDRFTSDDDLPSLCIATASAAKFSEVLVETGLPLCRSEKIERLRELDKTVQFLSKKENWETVIREKVIDISKRIMT